jgi:16S rRNA (uracil1498-N3)-methyltransferase
VLLFNGAEGEWRARITVIGRERARFAVEARIRPQPEEPPLILLFALLKRDATDLAVRQATELGATLIQPVLTARTNAARTNLARLAAIAEEAAEQSGRLSVPVLRPPAPLADVLAAWPAGRPLALARPGAPPPAADADARALLVGPEGGFTPAELDALARHKFVAPLGLGPHVLRAETAIVAGLAVLHARHSCDALPS